MMKFWTKKEEDRQVEWFLKNGGTFLQALIADCDGKSNPIRSFSSDQILRATNNFDWSCYLSDHECYDLYEGIIEDRLYMIKKYAVEEATGHRIRGFYNDIVMSARMSGHKNFLKLFGCCLEFPFLVLVFEYAENGVLNPQGGAGSDYKSLLPWNVRLKIAKEVANAVTYLHTAFQRIIIHTDINPMHIFLDRSWAAKLSDFSLSISIPEGKSQIEVYKVWGTYGYIDPSYCCLGVITEYTDVFSFGIFLMVLLIGKPALVRSDGDGSSMHILDYVKGLKENGEFIGIADGEKDMADGQRSQMEAFIELALRCCLDRQEDRPKMIEVAKELKQIERSHVNAKSIGSPLNSPRHEYGPPDS